MTEEIKCLKNEIKALRKDLNKPNVAKEELLTFDMLDRHRHIINQQAWLWRWENIDALYTLTDHIPAWVVDDTIMSIWASGRQGLPNSFMNWDSPKKEAGMALMLNWVRQLLYPWNLGVRGLVSSLPLERVVGPPPLSPRLLLPPRSLNPPKHCPLHIRHPRWITLMVPQRPKLQRCLQNPRRCSVPKPPPPLPSLRA